LWWIARKDISISPARQKNQLYDFLVGWMRALRHLIFLRRSRTSVTRHAIDLAALSREASLDWDDLAKLAADPLVTLGSATVSYPVLSSLKDSLRSAK